MLIPVISSLPLGPSSLWTDGSLPGGDTYTQGVRLVCSAVRYATDGTEYVKFHIDTSPLIQHCISGPSSNIRSQRNQRCLEVVAQSVPAS